MSTLATILLAFTVFVPDAAVEEIAYVESRHNPKAVSPAGAIGYMQVLPSTARDPGYGVEPLDNPWDKSESKRFGREYFSALIAEYGSIKLALMAYNWGPGSVNRWIRAGKPDYMVPEETKRYVRLLENRVKQAIEREWTNRIYRSFKKGVDRYVVRDGTTSGPSIRLPGSGSMPSINVERTMVMLHYLTGPPEMPMRFRSSFDPAKSRSI